MQVSAALAPIVDLIFPPRCPLCGEALAEQGGLCAACWSGLAIPGEPACSTCQRPFPDGTALGSVCAPCMAQPPRHAGIHSATLYNDNSRRLILAFKRGGRIAMAPMLARLMLARLPHLEGDWTVVPVPLHRWRIWHRGFNQSALLARELARARDLPMIVDGLVRRKATPVLGGLGAKARVRALSGVMTINPRRKAQIEGRNILLVDDVMTSGATTDACIGVLKRAGARQVKVSCFARVLNEALDHA